MKKYFLIFALALYIFSCSTNSTTEPEVISELQNTEWALSFAVQNGNIIFPPDNIPYTIQFADTAQTVSGSVSCNGFYGHYSTDGSRSLRIENLATTLAFCVDDPVGPHFLNILEMAKTYLIEGNQLSLLHEINDNALVFEAIEKATE